MKRKVIGTTLAALMAWGAVGTCLAADRIAAGRPSLREADLVTSNVIPAGVCLSINCMIIAKPGPNGLSGSKGRS